MVRRPNPAGTGIRAGDAPDLYPEDGPCCVWHHRPRNCDELGATTIYTISANSGLKSNHPPESLNSLGSPHPLLLVLDCINPISRRAGWSGSLLRCRLHQRLHRRHNHVTQHRLRLLGGLQLFKIALRCRRIGSVVVLEIVKRPQPDGGNL